MSLSLLLAVLTAEKNNFMGKSNLYTERWLPPRVYSFTVLPFIILTHSQFSEIVHGYYYLAFVLIASNVSYLVIIMIGISITKFLRSSYTSIGLVNNGSESLSSNIEATQSIIDGNCKGIFVRQRWIKARKFKKIVVIEIDDSNDHSECHYYHCSLLYFRSCIDYGEWPKKSEIYEVSKLLLQVMLPL